MFLWQFPTVMDNHISIEWDTITSLFDKLYTFPITLIHTEILNGWHSNPVMWEVDRRACSTPSMRWPWSATPFQSTTSANPSESMGCPLYTAGLYQLIGHLDISGICQGWLHHVSGLVQSFTTATLLTASREGWSGDMVTPVKLLPWFGCPKKNQCWQEVLCGRMPTSLSIPVTGLSATGLVNPSAKRSLLI